MKCQDKINLLYFCKKKEIDITLFPESSHDICVKIYIKYGCYSTRKKAKAWSIYSNVEKGNHQSEMIYITQTWYQYNAEFHRDYKKCTGGLIWSLEVSKRNHFRVFKNGIVYIWSPGLHIWNNIYWWTDKGCGIAFMWRLWWICIKFTLDMDLDFILSTFFSYHGHLRQEVGPPVEVKCCVKHNFHWRLI